MSTRAAADHSTVRGQGRHCLKAPCDLHGDRCVPKRCPCFVEKHSLGALIDGLRLCRAVTDGGQADPAMLGETADRRNFFTASLRKGEKVLLLPLIQHPINHHTGYGNIQPQRQRPARNLAMLVEPLFERTRESNQCQWEDDGR